MKVDKEDAQFKKFISIFKLLHINITIVEALCKMMKYAKFLKDFLTNKRKLEEVYIVALNGNYFAILDRKLLTRTKRSCEFCDVVLVRLWHRKACTSQLWV